MSKVTLTIETDDIKTTESFDKAGGNIEKMHKIFEILRKEAPENTRIVDFVIPVLKSTETLDVEKIMLIIAVSRYFERAIAEKEHDKTMNELLAALEAASKKTDESVH